MNTSQFQTLKDEINKLTEEIKAADYGHDLDNAAYDSARKRLTDLQSKLLEYIVAMVKGSKTNNTAKIESLNTMLKDFLQIFSSLGKKITELDSSQTT